MLGSVFRFRRRDVGERHGAKRRARRPVAMTTALAAVVTIVLALIAVARSRRDNPVGDAGEDAESTTLQPIPQQPAQDDRPLEYRSIAAHFAATAHRIPDRVAMRTETDTVTYRELLHAAQASRPRFGDTRRAAVLPAR